MSRRRKRINASAYEEQVEAEMKHVGKDNVLTLDKFRDFAVSMQEQGLLTRNCIIVHPALAKMGRKDGCIRGGIPLNEAAHITMIEQGWTYEGNLYAPSKCNPFVGECAIASVYSKEKILPL